MLNIIFERDQQVYLDSKTKHLVNVQTFKQMVENLHKIIRIKSSPED